MVSAGFKLSYPIPTRDNQTYTACNISERWCPITRTLRLISIATSMGRSPSAVHRAARAKAVSIVEAKTESIREHEIQRMLSFFRAVLHPSPWNPWLVRHTLAWCWPNVARKQVANDLGYHPKIYTIK